MEVLEAIKTRRSIRRYKNTPVDDKTIEQLSLIHISEPTRPY